MTYSRFCLRMYEYCSFLELNFGITAAIVGEKKLDKGKFLPQRDEKCGSGKTRYVRGLSVLVTGLLGAFETKRCRNAEITFNVCPSVRSYTFTSWVTAGMVLHESSFRHQEDRNSRIFKHNSSFVGVYLSKC